MPIHEIIRILDEGAVLKFPTTISVSDWSEAKSEAIRLLKQLQGDSKDKGD